MEIKTKFDIEDTVYFIDSSGKVQVNLIKGINIKIGEVLCSYYPYSITFDTPIIEYRLQHQVLTEDKLFRTKQELIDSL